MWVATLFCIWPPLLVRVPGTWSAECHAGSTVTLLMTAACSASAGFECKASTRCKRLACSANQGIFTEPCFGLCTATDRTILSAKLADNGREITVALSTRAADAMFPCSKVFDVTTSGLLGYAASCMVYGTTLRVVLAGDATIIPGAAMTLAASQDVLIDAMSVDVVKFTNPTPAITLTTCSNCVQPAVSVVGPKVILSCIHSDLLQSDRTALSCKVDLCSG